MVTSLPPHYLILSRLWMSRTPLSYRRLITTTKIKISHLIYLLLILPSMATPPLKRQCIENTLPLSTQSNSPCSHPAHPPATTTLFEHEPPAGPSLRQSLTNGHIEGYWAPPARYPTPVPSLVPWTGRQEFVDKLARVEQWASDMGHVAQFRGMSNCRLCGEMNGFRQYSVPSARVEGKRLVWPEGLLHYVKDHAVLPSLEFYRLIMKMVLTTQDAIRSKELYPGPPAPSLQINPRQAPRSRMRLSTPPATARAFAAAEKTKQSAPDQQPPTPFTITVTGPTDRVNSLQLAALRDIVAKRACLPGRQLIIQHGKQLGIDTQAVQCAQATAGIYPILTRACPALEPAHENQYLQSTMTEPRRSLDASFSRMCQDSDECYIFADHDRRLNIRVSWLTLAAKQFQKPLFVIHIDGTCKQL